MVLEALFLILQSYLHQLVGAYQKEKKVAKSMFSIWNSEYKVLIR